EVEVAELIPGDEVADMTVFRERATLDLPAFGYGRTLVAAPCAERFAIEEHAPAGRGFRIADCRLRGADDGMPIRDRADRRFRKSHKGGRVHPGRGSGVARPCRTLQCAAPRGR